MVHVNFSERTYAFKSNQTFQTAPPYYKLDEKDIRVNDTLPFHDCDKSVKEEVEYKLLLTRIARARIPKFRIRSQNNLGKENQASSLLDREFKPKN